MKAANIVAHEADFRARGVDSDGKTFALNPFTVTVPGSSETIPIVGCKPRNGDQSYVYPEVVPKKRIVVHFTAGYLKGDVAALTKKDNHVSVPFVVARDGTIYNLWPSKYWSYHLGPGAQGGNKEMSSSAVAIELSNVGYLRLKGGNLVTYMSDQDVYCTTADKSLYTQVTQPFRGYTYFASHTEAQYRSLGALLRYLTATFDIPPAFIPEAQRYDVYPGVGSFSGITTHVNYQPQKYGKWDIGPGFDWQRMAAELAKTATVDVAGATLPTRTPALD
jgi:N-acetylmuramoyl-L-alanine amidase